MRIMYVVRDCVLVVLPGKDDSYRQQKESEKDERRREKAREGESR